MLDHIVYPSDLKKYNPVKTDTFLPYGFEEKLLTIPNDFNDFLIKKSKELEKLHTELGYFCPTYEDGRPKEYCPCNDGHFNYYNLFHFHHPFIFEIHKTIREMTINFCEKNNINFDEQMFMLHGFFSTAKIRKEFDWHDHGEEPTHLHGFLPIDAEPSETYYYIDKKFLDIKTVNGRIVVGKNAMHTKGTWNADRPRTVVAFNIKPLPESPIDRHYILL